MIGDDEQLAERYGLVPVLMEDKIDGSDIAAVPWSDVVPLLRHLASREARPVTLGWAQKGEPDAYGDEMRRIHDAHAASNGGCWHDWCGDVCLKCGGRA